MPLRIVQSKQNPRLKQLRRALAQPLRDADAHGRILAGIEGPNLLEEALRAHLHIECVFVAEGAEPLLKGFALPPELDVLVVPRDFLAQSLTTEAPQPVAALVEPPQWTWAHIFGVHQQSAPLIVILGGLQDPGNLGAILRAAEAFAVGGILSLPGTVSAWNPKAVRASAGSVFRLPLLSVSEEECFLHLRNAGIKIWTTAVHNAVAATNANLSGPAALLIGNEGNGVAPSVAVQADASLTIPYPGPVESLNAAVAAGILLYEAARQRAAMPVAPHLRGNAPKAKNRGRAR